MNPTEEAMAAAVVDGLGLPPCQSERGSCPGHYRRQDYTFGLMMKDSQLLHLTAADHLDHAWKCDVCGSTTFDSLLPK